MKSFSLLLFSTLAWFALAGCGDDPVIVDPGGGKKTDLGLAGTPDVTTPEPEPEPEPKPRPPLPELVLEPPYSGYLKEAVDYEELHFGKRQENKPVDPLALMRTSPHAHSIEALQTAGYLSQRLAVSLDTIGPKSPG